MIDRDLIRPNSVDFRSKEGAYNSGEDIIEVAYDILGICRVRIYGNPAASCHVGPRAASGGFQRGITHWRARRFTPRLAPACPLPAIAIAGRHARLVGIVLLQGRLQLRFRQREAFFTRFANFAWERLQLAADRRELRASLPQQFILVRPGKRADRLGDLELRVQSPWHGTQSAR